MKGYIYSMFGGADPGLGWLLNDPIFVPKPTLGACMPNVRRAVVPGDWIFVVSGSARGVQQYVVGGFKVDEKISTMAAYRRFPEYRLQERCDGTLSGNIIVNSRGTQHPLDYHTGFERRVDNYVVGSESVYLQGAAAVQRSRLDTLPFLESLFDRSGSRVADVIGRWRRLNEDHIEAMVSWLHHLKKSSGD